MEKFKAFCKRKNIEVSAKRYGIDALGAMAQGLFCSLLIGTIIKTLGAQLGVPFLTDIGTYAMSVSGPAMAIAIGYALQAPPMALFSLACERDADKHRDRDAHPERLELGRIVDDNAKRRGRRADGRGDPLGERDADQDGHGGRDQNVDLRLLAHGLAALGGKDRDDEHGERAACAALGVGRMAHRREGEEHHRGCLQRVADGNGHRRACPDEAAFERTKDALRALGLLLEESGN